LTDHDQPGGPARSSVAGALADPAIVVDGAGRAIAWNAAAALRFALDDGATGRYPDELGLAAQLPRATRIALDTDGAGANDGAAAILAWLPAVPGIVEVASPTPPPPDAAAELALHRAELLRRLAPNVSHDYVNTAASVKSFVSMLNGEPTIVEELGAELVAGASEAASRGLTLMQAYLELARIREPIVVSASIASAVRRALPLVEYDILTGVECEVDLPRDLPAIEADEGRLHLALATLLVHAVEALGGKQASGRLTIRARTGQPAGHVELRITDSAPTVAAGDQARLFDPTPDARGSIVGHDLAIARRLLAAFDADLRYEPGTDRGNTLVVLLPTSTSGPIPPPPAPVEAAPPPGTAPSPSTAPSPTAAGLTVLVCDDDSAIRQLLTRQFTKQGCAVAAAASAGEALEILAQTRVDAVVADNRMAVMTGPELYLETVARYPGLRDRFVLMSGDAEEPDLAAFAATHGLTVVGKPFDLTVVEAIVRRIAAS
jgi:CheY-like chemotaxis protein/signal transduction histidine kinase